MDIYLWDADEIKKLRRRLGVSQQGLAQRAGCSVRAVTMWESGQILPNAIHQARLHEISRQYEQALL